MLIIMGLSISFSTLQDTYKVQNKFSKKVWQSPIKAQKLIIGLSLAISLTISTGVFFYFNAINSAIKKDSFGLIVFSIRLIGLLKSAIEIFEKNRRDKKLNN